MEFGQPPLQLLKLRLQSLHLLLLPGLHVQSHLAAAASESASWCMPALKHIKQQSTALRAIVHMHCKQLGAHRVCEVKGLGADSPLDSRGCQLLVYALELRLLQGQLVQFCCPLLLRCQCVRLGLLCSLLNCKSGGLCSFQAGLDCCRTACHPLLQVQTAASEPVLHDVWPGRLAHLRLPLCVLVDRESTQSCQRVQAALQRWLRELHSCGQRLERSPGLWREAARRCSCSLKQVQDEHACRHRISGQIEQDC